MSGDDGKDTSFESWDRLRHPVVSDRGREARQTAPAPANEGPNRLQLMAVAWGELVAILGVWTATLVGLVAFGHHVVLPCFPWAAATAVCWWLAATTVMLVVRRATPGMVMAGLRYSRAPASARLPLILAVAVASALTLGLLNLIGAGCALQRACGAELRLVDR